MKRTNGFFLFLRRAALPCCLLLILFAATGAAQEERAGYEKALERKAERTLAGLLGPGQAKVMVRAEQGVRAAAREDGASPEVPSAQPGRLTVLIIPGDSVTDGDAQKARAAVSGLPGIVPGRGDEVLVMKSWFAPGRVGPGRTAGPGYARQGLLLLAGIFLGFIFFRAGKPAAAVKAAAGARALPPAQYVPPPAQPAARPADDDELNIPSRSGFYKH